VGLEGARKATPCRAHLVHALGSRPHATGCYRMPEAVRKDA
jgi:hypothetical protein